MGTFLAYTVALSFTAQSQRIHAGLNSCKAVNAFMQARQKLCIQLVILCTQVYPTTQRHHDNRIAVLSESTMHKNA